MENSIIVILLAAIVGAVLWYLLRAKKQGAKCIGCPYAKQCGGNGNNSCGHCTKPNTESDPE